MLRVYCPLYVFSWLLYLIVQAYNIFMLRIYCDGACSGNPGPGAWAYIAFDGNLIVASANGAFSETTNNRMELLSAINAAFAFDNCTIIVDSKYVKDGITDWIKKWRMNGWKSSTGAVKNIDLWQKLDHITSLKNICWEWEKGHNNSTHDLVDELARGSVLR